MADPNEIEALKASLRGALSTGQALASLTTRVEQLDPRGDVPPADLDELGHLSLAHAVAAQALRGLIETMRTRRGMPAA